MWAGVGAGELASDLVEGVAELGGHHHRSPGRARPSTRSLRSFRYTSAVSR
jgi:hypothetical protein